MGTQFARVESYSATSKTTIGGVLDEATRVPEACPHVEHPEPPTWVLGSRAEVEAAVEAHMNSGSTVRKKDGTVATRKRRADHRALVAGVLSHPLPMNDLRGFDKLGLKQKLDAIARADAVRRWRDDAVRWLKQQFGSRLIGVVEHRDESHPHLHFFVVGDAQRLHPGLRAELVNGVRSDDASARRTAHRAALKAWLDDYHQAVGQRHGMERGDGSSRPIWRIKDRSARARLHDLAQQIAAVTDEQKRVALTESWNDEYDEQEHVPRPRTRY